MNRNLILSISAALTLVCASAAQAAAVGETSPSAQAARSQRMEASLANARQANQKDRIAAGVAAGSVTAKEAARLNQQQAHISKLKREAAVGGTSPRQAVAVAKAQKHASRSIYRAKHNKKHKVHAKHAHVQAPVIK